MCVNGRKEEQGEGGELQDRLTDALTGWDMPSNDRKLLLVI